MRSRTPKSPRHSGPNTKEPKSYPYRNHGLEHTATRCAPLALRRPTQRDLFLPNGPKWAAQHGRENRGPRRKRGKPSNGDPTNRPSPPPPSPTSPRKARKRLGWARRSSYYGMISRTTPLPNSKYPRLWYRHTSRKHFGRSSTSHSVSACAPAASCHR